MSKTWTYPRARVVGVEDGDTVWLFVDQGLDTWRYTSCRLAGMNAREKRDPGGAEAKAWLEERLPPGLFVAVTSVKYDKYARRIVGYIQLPDGQDITAAMITAGYACPWDGRGKKPVPPWPIPAA